MTAHDKILIVDFGSQVTQLIARRVREEGVYSRDRAVPEGGRSLRRDEAARRDPLRRPGLGAPRRRRRARRRRSSRPACRCSASATASRRWRRSSAARSRAGITASSAAPRSRSSSDSRAVRRRVAEGREISGLDEPRRPRHQAAAGLRGGRRLGERAVRRHRGREAQVLRACSSIPRWCTRRTARRCCAISCARSPARRGDWTMRAFKDEAIDKIRAQVGKGRVICGLSGGVDSAVAAVLIHEAIGEQLTCVFVDHGLLRLGEAREGRARCSATATTSRWCTWRPRSCSSARSKASPTRRSKRKTIGKLFIDVFEAEAKKIGGAEFPGAGHALSGRDRERVVHRRAVGDDQVAPQCRRPARAHEHEAGRAAARTVQGRGARARPRARPAGGVRRPPSVSRAGPRDPLPGRDHAREARHPAPGRRRLSSRRSAAPASTTTSGRPSR